MVKFLMINSIKCRVDILIYSQILYVANSYYMNYNINKFKYIPLMQLTNLPTLESFCLPELTPELRSSP